MRAIWGGGAPNPWPFRLEQHGTTPTHPPLPHRANSHAGRGATAEQQQQQPKQQQKGGGGVKKQKGGKQQQQDKAQSTSSAEEIRALRIQKVGAPAAARAAAACWPRHDGSGSGNGSGRVGA